MKKIIFSFALIAILFIAVFNQSSAQLDCTTNDCVPPASWIASPFPIILKLSAPECEITINYEWRVCNGVYQYNYTSFTATGNCTQMDDFGIYHYSISTLKEMADMIIAEQTFALDGHDILSWIPNCGNGVYRKAKFYSAGCGVWVKCSYKVDRNAVVQKDRGYDGNCPTPNEADYIDVWKWQSCGEVCCVREYEICKYISPITGVTQVKVTQFPAYTLNGSTCTLQNNFGPWQNPSVNYQCQHACNN